MRWPWRRRERPIVNGEARKAKRRAERKLDEQQQRWPEVVQASDRFAAIVEQALRGNR